MQTGRAGRYALLCLLWLGVSGGRAPRDARLPEGVDFDGDNSINDLKTDILADIIKLDDLKVKISLAQEKGNDIESASLTDTMAHLFVEIQLKFDIIKEAWSVSKNVEHDIQNIEQLYTYSSQSSGGVHISDDVLAGLVNDPLFPSDLATEIFGYQNKNDFIGLYGLKEGAKNEDDILSKLFDNFEDMDVDKIEESIKLLESVTKDSHDHVKIKRHLSDSQWGQLMNMLEFNKHLSSKKISNSNKLYIESENERSIEGVRQKLIECVNMPKTTELARWVWKKKAESEDRLTCAGNIKKSTKAIKKGLEQLQYLTEALGRMKNATETIELTLLPLSQAPIIGSYASLARTFVRSVNNNIDAIEPKVRMVYNRVKVIKTPNSLLAKASTAFKYLFTAASQSFGLAGERIDSDISRLCNNRNSEQYNMEKWSTSILNNPRVPEINQYYNQAQPPCDISLIIGTIEANFKLHAIDAYTTAVQKIDTILGPLFAVFDEVAKVMNKELCMPNPLELTREGLETAREFAAKAVNTVVNWFKSWRRRRRRRGTSQPLGREEVFLHKREAIAFLSKRHLKAGTICFSVRTILEGIDAVFNFLFGWAKDLLNALIGKIPFINDLGLPSLNLNFDYLNTFDLNIPTDLPLMTMDLDFLDHLTISQTDEILLEAGGGGCTSCDEDPLLE